MDSTGRVRLVLASLLLVALAACSGATGGTTSAAPPTTVSPTSTLVLTTSTSAPSTSTASVPASISGYGDFSGQEYFEVDWFLVTELTVQCVQDHGFAVSLIPPGDGISFQSVPPDQNQLAGQYLDACTTGLNLPEYEQASAEQLEVVYHYYLTLRDCLIAEDYTVSEPPSLDAFVDSYYSDTGPWTPYANVVSDWEAIQLKCPQSPPGGWASWQPGDPITPVTSADS